ATPALFSSPPPLLPSFHPPSLHDALPISVDHTVDNGRNLCRGHYLGASGARAEESHSRRRTLGEGARRPGRPSRRAPSPSVRRRSEEHTSELQSPDHLVCHLLLEKTNTDR